jgi:hypothetical protein
MESGREGEKERVGEGEAEKKKGERRKEKAGIRRTTNAERRSRRGRGSVI